MRTMATGLVSGRAELSRSDLTGSRLQRSSLDRIRGAGSLRGATIGSDQVLPAAVALFGALGITVQDDDT
jgi:hypothetical protein